MPEPCRSCDQRGVDFGGCRCQAYHLTGDMTATDPACELAPRHDLVLRARADSEAEAINAAPSTDPSLIRLRRPPSSDRG